MDQLASDRGSDGDHAAVVRLFLLSMLHAYGIEPGTRAQASRLFERLAPPVVWAASPPTAGLECTRTSTVDLTIEVCRCFHALWIDARTQTPESMLQLLAWCAELVLGCGSATVASRMGTLTQGPGILPLLDHEQRHRAVRLAARRLSAGDHARVVDVCRRLEAAEWSRVSYLPLWALACPPHRPSARFEYALLLAMSDAVEGPWGLAAGAPPS